MNLIDRIKQGLTINTGKWLHSHLIYTKMQSEGYTTDAITRALDTIHHEPPFAKMNVDGDDHRTLKEMGVTIGGYYYTCHPMTPAELARNKEALDAFDAL